MSFTRTELSPPSVRPLSTCNAVDLFSLCNSLQLHGVDLAISRGMEQRPYGAGPSPLYGACTPRAAQVRHPVKKHAADSVKQSIPRACSQNRVSDGEEHVPDTVKSVPSDTSDARQTEEAHAGL